MSFVHSANVKSFFFCRFMVPLWSTMSPVGCMEMGKKIILNYSHQSLLTYHSFTDCSELQLMCTRRLTAGPPSCGHRSIPTLTITTGTLGNRHIITTVAASCSYVITICSLPCWLSDRVPILNCGH